MIRNSQKYHQYLVHGITLTTGVFGGLLFCNLSFPSSITDEAKILCSLAIGFALWYVAVQGEEVILQIFGISAGMATGTVVFNLVAEFYIINAHFLILALAVVRRMFFACLPLSVLPVPQAQKYMIRYLKYVYTGSRT